MTVGGAIERLLESLEAGPWEGTVYRVMLGEAPPERENTLGARWNPPEVAAIYTSLQAAAAIAEVEYNLARQPRPVRPDLKKTIYELEIRLSAVVNLSPALRDLEALGVGRSQLFADDLRATQEVGRSVTWFGYDGLFVPSARAEGDNLVIYPSRANSETYRFEVRSRKLL